jgi:hypothetical protein
MTRTSRLTLPFFNYRQTTEKIGADQAGQPTLNFSDLHLPIFNGLVKIAKNPKNTKPAYQPVYEAKRSNKIKADLDRRQKPAKKSYPNAGSTCRQ